MKKKQKFDVITPDGFSIHISDTYSSEAEAIAAFNVWKKRYEHQGYYSANSGRIPLDELFSRCRIVKV